MEKIIIKRATIKDLSNVVQLFDNYRVFYKRESDLIGAKTFIQERLKNDDSVIYIAEGRNKQGIGFVQLYPIFSSTQMKRFWLLNDLFVSYESRGLGISYMLINEAKKLSIGTKSAGLMLETAKDNLIGNQLYPKAGFELDTEHNFYYWTPK